MAGHVDPTKEGFARFREMGRAGPVHMLNLVRLRDRAAYEDGTAATGAAAYRAYARESGPIFARLGGRQVWLGAPELTLIGPADERWDLAFIAEYPSVDSFVAMLRDPDYRKAVRHRQAAVADSRLIRLQPAAPGARFGESAGAVSATSARDQGVPDMTNPTLTAPVGPDGAAPLGVPVEIPARQGRAFVLRAGQVLRLVNTHGSQVADFWAFSADDPGEYLSMEHVRAALRRLTPRPGDVLVSNRREPLLTLLADTSPGVHDTLIACCDVHRYRQLGHDGLHDNCTDNLRQALLAIGRRAVEIPCPFNIWMNTPPVADGSIAYLAPVSRPGDLVELRAERDCVAVVSACPMDLLPINGADNTPKALHALVQAAA